MVAEGDAAFSQEMRESLVPKANLSGHSFEGPAGSVGSLRLLKEVFGCPQLLLRESSMVVRSVPSSSDRLVCSHHLTHRWGEFRQASRQVHHKRLTRNITYVNVGVALREFLLEGFLVAGELGGRSVVRPTPPRLGARCRGGADGCGDREGGSMHRARGT